MSIAQVSFIPAAAVSDSDRLRYMLQDQIKMRTLVEASSSCLKQL